MTRNNISPRSRSPLALALALALVLTACGDDQPQPAPIEAASTESPASIEPAPAPTPSGPTTALPPNELGEIMVLEYHRLGENEGEWIRSAEHFKEDLANLYERGYRPITMRQLLSGDINTPAGTTPVVFTFDDSSLGQFYFLDDGSIDPNTMVGMWAAFQEQNPAWSNGGVWCILPGAEHPSNFFGKHPSKEVPREEREANIRRKVDYLTANGHEICNHTMWHARLDKYDDAFVQDQIGSGEDSIQAYLPPDYDIVTFALPLGMWPETESLAWQGTYREGKEYSYDAVLEVAGGPNESPFDIAFDPHSVNRFVMAPGALDRQLAAYEQRPGDRFISDGLPDVVSVPANRINDLNQQRVGDREVRTVESP